MKDLIISQAVGAKMYFDFVMNQSGLYNRKKLKIS